MKLKWIVYGIVIAIITPVLAITNSYAFWSKEVDIIFGIVIIAAGYYYKRSQT